MINHSSQLVSPLFNPYHSSVTINHRISTQHPRLPRLGLPGGLGRLALTAAGVALQLGTLGGVPLLGEMTVVMANSWREVIVKHG